MWYEGIEMSSKLYNNFTGYNRIAFVHLTGDYNWILLGEMGYDCVSAIAVFNDSIP